jgi:hypothetical protein
VTKVAASPDFSQVEDVEQLKRFSSIVVRELVDVVNGNLSFGDNFKCTVATVSFPSADVEQQIFHNLGRAPVGYVLVSANVAMNLYDGGSANTASELYLKSSAVGTAKIIIL